MQKCKAGDVKRLVKKTMAWVYCKSGLVCLKLNKMSRSAYPILMYHRVISETEATNGIQPGMYVTPDTFERHVAYLKKNFSIVSLKEAVSLSGGGRFPAKQDPFCVITFDDGWIDFYGNVYPLLKQLQIPATVFLPTAFIGERELFWTDRLVSLFYGRKKYTEKVKQASNHLVKIIENLKGNREMIIENAIAILKKNPLCEIEKVLSLLSDRWGMDYSEGKRVFINWREVDEMLRSGLVSFGAHTHRHQILTILKNEEIADELITSRDRLLSMDALDPGFIPFCYPNGNCNDSVAILVKDFGFAAAVTTQSGWNGCASDLYRLKRVPVHQDMTCSDMMFGCRLVGLL